MRQTIKEFLANHNSSTKQIYKKRTIITILSLVVILGVVNLLKLPANTLQHPKYQKTVKEFQCEYRDINEEDEITIVHTHDEYCLEEWCTLPENEAHEHTTSCYEEQLTCELSEAQNLSLHQHDEACYEIEKQLICSLPEVESHQHTETCNTTYLDCKEVESEVHTHDETCYREVVCEKEEIEGHTHDEACYQEIHNLVCESIEEPTAHTHTETCYTSVKICREPENEIIHQHTEGCYIFEEQVPIIDNEEIPEGYGDIKVLMNTPAVAGTYKFEVFVESEEVVDWSSIEGKKLLYTKAINAPQWSLYWDSFKKTDSNAVSMDLTLGDWDLDKVYWFKHIPQRVSLSNSSTESLPVKLRITELSGKPVRYLVNEEPILDGVVEIQDQGVITITIDEEEKKEEEEEEFDFSTEHTILKYIEEYTIENILKNYNVFSFSDIESTHIVGPIVAKDKAYRTRKDGPLTSTQDWDPLVASDWSRKIASYVGQLLSTPKEGHEARSFQMNYGFDDQNIDPVNLYVSTQNELLYKYVDIKNSGLYRDKEKEKKKRFVFKAGEREILSPNRSGEWQVLMNDDFIDWETAERIVETQAENLMDDKNNIRVGTTKASDNSQLEPYTINETTGYLKLDAGKNYIIEDAKGLRLIDIVFPEGYGPVEKDGVKRLEENTIINIENPVSLKDPIKFSGFQAEEYVGEKTYQSIWDKTVENVYLFPTLFINGKHSPQTGTGIGEEYVEEGGSIVLNMPTVEGRLLKQDGYEIMAHIIAPRAEFWAVTPDGGGKWEGGNLNGSAIVKSYHGGNIEAHMYPYEGDLEEENSSVDLSLEGKKRFYDNGVLEPSLEDGEFKFILERADDQEGVEDTNLPQTVSVKPDGTIKFLPITFNKPGEYSFIIREDIPDSSGDIVYDRTTYKVIATVNKVDGSLKVTTKIFKVTTQTGEPIEPPEELDEGILFVNTKGINELVEFSFTKVAQGEAGSVLPGAQFTLQEVESTENHQVIENAPIYKATSDEQGKVHFTHIPSNKVYKMIEVAPPDGYEKPAESQYWIVEIKGIGETLEITITAIGDEAFKKMTSSDTQSGKIQISNKPTGEKGFKIKKVDESNNDLGLEDASFAIYEAKVDSAGKLVIPVEPKDKESPLLKDLVTDENGYIHIKYPDIEHPERPELEYNKIYLLEETQAPIGYVRDEAYIPFYIKDPNGTGIEDVDLPDNLVIIENMGEIVIKNSQYELPETGGEGTRSYTLIGISLMLGAIGCILYRKRIIRNY